MIARDALAAGILMALIVACQPTAREAGPLSEEDVAAIEASPEAFAEAILAGDWVALAAWFTEDAVLMPPNGPAVEGRAAILAWLEPFPTVEKRDATILEIDGRGDLAVVRGTYSEIYTIEGMPEPIHDTGKYVEIWRKQTDGTWLIAVEIWNADLPLPEGAAQAET